MVCPHHFQGETLTAEAMGTKSWLGWTGPRSYLEHLRLLHAGPTLSWCPLTIVIMYLVATNSFAPSPEDVSPVVSSLYNLTEFFNKQKTRDISGFCSAQCIEWRFIPECAPHFGGLWEAAVKSMKFHFKWIIGTTKLTFEELTTILAQIESCLNSHPLAPLPHEEDNIVALTSGHFLIGKPLESIPDPSPSYCNLSLLKRWYLC